MFRFCFIFIAILSLLFNSLYAQAFQKKDYRARELKYQYEVLKEDKKNQMEGKILNLKPSGYMTTDEYEALSEYKSKTDYEFEIPKFQTPADFKYVPKPTYKLVKYNDPPGSAELTLGKKIYALRQINAQGIVSPNFSMLIYPAVYYYTDSASVAADLFIIPLDENEKNLEKVMKANIAKRIPEPILSTDKAIDNYASFRTLTPVDFSSDGTKLLVKRKTGSSEDGIWETSIFIYDFVNKIDYDLSEIRDAISYFWKEYMDLNLENIRWDIYPLGFDANEPDFIIVDAYAYTGEKPVFLGTWSVDWQGNRSKVISFDKDYTPQISVNGYKLVQSGNVPYNMLKSEEKSDLILSKQIKKDYEKKEKDAIKAIKDDYKYELKELNQNYKDEYRDYRKLRAISGPTNSAEAQAAYLKYLKDQLKKDINKTERKIEKTKNQIEKTNQKLDKMYENSNPQPTETQEKAVPTIRS